MRLTMHLTILLSLVLCCIGLMRSAHADAGDIRVGGFASGGLGSTAEVRLGGVLAYGLMHSLSARADIAGGYAVASPACSKVSGCGWGGTSRAFLVLAWDVFTWVPELTLGGGVRIAAADDVGLQASGLGAMSLGLQRYINLDWSLGVNVTGEVGPHFWSTQLMLTLWRSIHT